MNSFDVIILSVNGRGASLAHRLPPLKKTAVIEMSYDCAREDEEGPFGFFVHSRRPSHWVESSAGFSVKTLEKSFHFKEVFLSSVYQKRKEYQNLLSVNSKSFKHLWLRALLRQLTRGEDISLNEAYVGEDFSFVFRDFGLLKSASQKFDSDISVFNSDGFSFNEKLSCFSHPEKGEIKSKNIICLLNPEEMKFLKESWHAFFFKSYVKPYWSWQRLSFEFEDEGHPVPLHLVLADPSRLPWSHERLICLKRSLMFEKGMEVWIKTPYSLCDFSESSQKVTETLEKYFPKFQWICKSKNWTTPSCLFPVYSKRALSGMPLKPHIQYGWSAEDLSLNGFYKREQNILKNLL